MAARQLHEAGLPGAEWLLAYLEGSRGDVPRMAGDTWSPADGRVLCPLVTGAAVSDMSGFGGASLRLLRLAAPALLLPFLSRLACRPALVFRVEFSTGHALACDRHIRVAGDPPAMGDVIIRRGDVTGDYPLKARRDVPVAIWSRLELLALATAVSASEASRLGAGAGTTDND